MIVRQRSQVSARLFAKRSPHWVRTSNRAPRRDYHDHSKADPHLDAAAEHADLWMGWRKFMRLIGGLAIAWPLASYAQEPKQPLKRVGGLALIPCPLQPDNLAVRRLAELGWIEGQNIVFDCVSTVGRVDQVPALARELVSRRPDVLTAGPYSFISALKQETTTIPIVMLNGWEPVRLGLITSLARPGGNVTGIAWFYLIAKQMELLKEIVPNLKRVAFVRGVAGVAGLPLFPE